MPSDSFSFIWHPGISCAGYTAETRYKDLDPVLHSRLRLALASILVNVKRADLAYLKQETAATAGNLSVQITKLKEAGYIDVKKKFKGNHP